VPLRISVAICTHNGASVLRKALRSIEAQTLPQDDFEVVVVDNASSDETPAIVREASERRRNMRYIREEKLGLSVARNTAARVADAGLLAFLDDDAEAAPQWLEALLSAFDRRSPVPACVGGPVSLDWGGTPPSWLPSRYRGLYSGLDLGVAGHYIASPEEYLIGANMAFRVDALRDNGGFDENLGRRGTTLISGEESALLGRFRAAGLPIYYEPQASVLHLVHPRRRTRRWLVSRTYWDGASQPLIDYGKGRSRRFYAWHVCRDGKRLAELSLRLSAVAFRRNSGRLADGALDFIQRLGRLRTNILLTATGGR